MRDRTPRQRAIAQARVLETIARKEGTRRTIASSLVHRFKRYGVPPKERVKNTARAFVWEMTGEREELLRLLTAVYRWLPPNYSGGAEGTGPEGGVTAPH